MIEKVISTPKRSQSNCDKPTPKPKCCSVVKNSLPRIGYVFSYRFLCFEISLGGLHYSTDVRAGCNYMGFDWV
jgi:hypothetical protein